jgi:hypothetical protein
MYTSSASADQVNLSRPSLQDKLGALLSPQLFQALDAHIHDSQHGVLVLTLDGPDPAIAPLLLLLDGQRLTFDAEHTHAAYKQPLVQIVGLARALCIVALGVVETCFQREVAAAEHGGAVQAEDVAGGNAVHVEG